MTKRTNRPSRSLTMQTEFQSWSRTNLEGLPLISDFIQRRKCWNFWAGLGNWFQLRFLRNVKRLCGVGKLNSFPFKHILHCKIHFLLLVHINIVVGGKHVIDNFINQRKITVAFKMYPVKPDSFHFRKKILYQLRDFFHLRSCCLVYDTNLKCDAPREHALVI